MHIVILPGWQQNSEHWRTISEQLTLAAIKHTLIDLPGFGKEPYQKQLLTIQDMATWLEERLTDISTNDTLVLVGHSYGGRIATVVASHKSNNIKGLVLIGSPNLYHPDFKTRLMKICNLLLLPFKKFIPERIKILLRSSDYKAVRGTELQNLFAEIIDEDQTQLLTKITIPTKLLWGDTDTQVPLSVARAMSELLPNASLEIIDGVGHDIHLEKPQLLAAKIITYAENL